DSEKDFDPIGIYGQTSGIFIAVTEASGIKTLQDLIARAKAQPGSLNYGSPGVGTLHQLMMEDLKLRTGIDVVHVPCRSRSEPVPALLSGQIEAVIASLPPLTGFVDEHKVRRLAVGMLQRSPLAPTVPTVAELVAPGFDHPGPEGLVVKAGPPAEIKA